MVIGSALIITLFLGGWSIGFGLDKYVENFHIGSFYFGGFIHMGAFLTKLLAFILFFILVLFIIIVLILILFLLFLAGFLYPLWLFGS